jgi:pimeloyl-ACP methyl ester carboxylesterase
MGAAVAMRCALMAPGLIRGLILVSPWLRISENTKRVERLRAIVMTQDSRTVAYAWAACLASDVDVAFGDIRIPSLVIAGMNDLFTPPYLARAVADALVEVELEVWGSGGHFPFLEDATRFNRRLEAYVRQHTARSTPE